MRSRAVSSGSLHRFRSVSSHHEARATLVQPDAHPTPRRDASHFWRLQTQFDRGSRHRPHKRTIPSLYLHQRPESRQIHRRDAVRHRRHQNRHGARRPRANSSGSLCYATSLSTEGNKWRRWARICCRFRDLFRASRRVASILVSASPPVTAASYR